LMLADCYVSLHNLHLCSWATHQQHHVAHA